MENFNPKQKELAHILIEIRQCQKLCLESQRTTFVGTMDEFCYTHEIFARVQREKPVKKQKRLIVEMRELIEKMGKDSPEVVAVLDYVDTQIRI